jgi:uncharacterized protein (TIGR02001 family)
LAIVILALTADCFSSSAANDTELKIELRYNANNSFFDLFFIFISLLTIQGGLDWDAGNGFALGIWGSNVADGSEFDYYGSYSGEAGDIGYEIGYIAYRYSKDAAGNRLNFNEAYVGASYGDFGLTYYKGNGEKTLEAGDYIEGSYGTSINDIDVSLTVGRYSEAVKGDSNDYKVYGVSLGRSYGGLDYALGFTKVKDSDSSAAYNTLNEKNTMFSISKSF